jgi:hypothetical protein
MLDASSDGTVKRLSSALNRAERFLAERPGESRPRKRQFQSNFRVAASSSHDGPSTDPTLAG